MAVKKRLSQKRKNKSNCMKLIRGGGYEAPDVVSQYINPMCHKMTQGFDGVDNIFQKVFTGPGAAETNLNVPFSNQSGGGSGLTLDLENTIEKSPSYVRYDNEAPPVLLNGKMMFSNCDINQCGGRKISLYKVKKMSNKKPGKKLMHKTKKSSMRKHNLRGGKSKRRSDKKRHAKRSKQRGGVAPVNYSSEFMNMGGSVNEESVFSPDMNTREFSCNQPVWSPKCI
jgi:hypothetical protein